MLFTPARRKRRNKGGRRNLILKQPLVLTFEHDLFKSNNTNSPSFQELGYDTLGKDSHGEVVSGEGTAFTLQVFGFF